MSSKNSNLLCYFMTQLVSAVWYWRREGILYNRWSPSFQFCFEIHSYGSSFTIGLASASHPTVPARSFSLLQINLGSCSLVPEEAEPQGKQGQGGQPRMNQNLEFTLDHLRVDNMPWREWLDIKTTLNQKTKQTWLGRPRLSKHFPCTGTPVSDRALIST